MKKEDIDPIIKCHFANYLLIQEKLYYYGRVLAVHGNYAIKFSITTSGVVIY